MRLLPLVAARRSYQPPPAPDRAGLGAPARRPGADRREGNAAATDMYIGKALAPGQRFFRFPGTFLRAGVK